MRYLDPGRFGYYIAWVWFVWGVAGWYRHGEYAQIVFIGIPSVFGYTAYPMSLLIFAGLLAVLTKMKGWKGIFWWILAGSTWDVIGSLAGQVWVSPEKFTPVWLWPFWAIVIMTCYLVLRREKIWWIIPPGFALAALFYYLPPSLAVEALTEIFWGGIMITGLRYFGVKPN